jgi:gamma-glutamyl-gamma-aminobutyrate hydrolase PuuD
VAWAADGALEAIERPGDRFCLAVQWHPEVGADHTLFAALVVAAADRLTSGVGEVPSARPDIPGR